MKEAQLKKIGNLLDAINEVVNDREIPINRVLIERNDGSSSSYGVVGSANPARLAKKEYTEEEQKARAQEHARLSNMIESYRIKELFDNEKILVTTTHLASALKKTKYEIISHLKNLVKKGKLNYIIQSFATKDDDPEYKKNVKLIDFDELANVEKDLPKGTTLFDVADAKAISTSIRNGIRGSEDMVAPM